MKASILTTTILCLAWLCAFGADAPDAAEPAPPDEVTIADGSVLHGKITSMTGGTLTIMTDFAGAVTVKWKEVTGVRTAAPQEFVLADGSMLKGSAEPVEKGAIRISTTQLAAPAQVSLEHITALNPPEVKPVTYKGNINIGASSTDGNTRNRSVSLAAGFEARSKRQRLTIGAASNYAKSSSGELTARNSRGRLKYDFFATDRLYFFVSALLEGDRFQNLDLRTTLSAGPGYQIIDKGDFESPYLNGMELLGEVGVSYFNENFRRDTRDESYMSGRWSAKLDWPLPVLGNTVSLFHFHEGYPSFEDIADLYISTEQGVRFALLKNLNATIQVNWRYDSTPSPGFKRADTMYLLTLGWNFDL